MKYTTLIIISALIVFSSVSCRNTRTAAHGPSWIIHVPEQWHLVERGNKSPVMSYAVYKREPISGTEGKNIVPSCTITSEQYNDTGNLKERALNRQSVIIASMQTRGYTLTKFRKDIQQEIKSAFRINNIISLSYEYQYENNARVFLFIAVFAQKNKNLINVSIESTADTYPGLRREIYQIISSIR